MIVYFADRQFNILGQAATGLPGGLIVAEDLKTEDAELGVSTFECKILFDAETRSKAKEWAAVGNYLLRNHDNENELYTIVEVEEDTKKQQLYIYAENDGMDLLNEVVGEYEATEAQPIEFYINKYASAAGWEIRTNEADGLVRKLSWDSEQTAAARIADIAAQFDGCEISYTFKINGLYVLKRYINIYKERGQSLGIQLRLNKDIDSIVTTKSISNIATALLCTGGTPDDAEEPITLLGYTYDDGDFYIDGDTLKSRTALDKWRRVFVTSGSSKGGHIEKLFSYDTVSQAVLLEKAIAELKILRDTEVNYEIDIKRLPENVRIGDRVNIVDDAGELYLSTRILSLETSVADQSVRAVLGEHILRKSGISQKVEKLAAKLAKSTISVKNAKKIANAAKKEAEEAQKTVDTARVEAENAKKTADAAKIAADNATEAADDATKKALAAEAAANRVVESVSSLEETIENAKTAADNAQAAAETAQTKADEAKTAAEQAAADAEEAKTSAENAHTTASNAITNAEKAKQSAEQAKADAEAAHQTAVNAKADAEQAEKDVAALGASLETVKSTMKTDYTRKTEFTETTADLQSQISRNAAEISSTVTKVVVIDETANDAQKQLQGAVAWAEIAQEQADQATADAAAAQTAADEARAAADNAQSEADTARAAADTARSVADAAEADLSAALADLATVTSRADATAEEIAAAQAAVDAARSEAEASKVVADNAAEIAEEAQKVANKAVANAEYAQTVADKAAENAEIAQAAADAAKGNAEQAQAIADEAASLAAQAQNTANEAKSTADTAKATADAAAQAAADAQKEVEEAAVKVTQAASDLAAAQQNLADVLANVDATAEEEAAAQAAVETAQEAADLAEEEAAAAQTAADTAAADAENAQAAADEARAAADNAQKALEEARMALEAAQAAVDGLSVRVINAGTAITQNADKIELRATKEEVSVAESTIRQIAESLSMLVRNESGGSLITQDADGLYYFDISALENSISDAANDLDELSGIVLDANGKIDVLNSSISALASRTEYIRSYTDDNDQPCIELGEGDSEFTVKITNTDIQFVEGQNVPTRIETDGMRTESITVESEFRHTTPSVSGQYVWRVRESGNYGLQWKGAD